MSCVACGQDLPSGAVFCHTCGTRQDAPACGGCGAELLPAAVFCSTCGTPTAGSPGSHTDAAEASGSERRLTSVLFADLVSYTTLSEQRDTEDVRELLTAYFDVCGTVVRRYGGTVEKFIGDAVMAVWGVPVAHEDDAERAVRAGLDLVGQVADLGEKVGAPLQLRVGVVTGEVAASLGVRDQGMVAGDPVNTAARVQSAAGPGEVWVDATTRSLTAAAVTYVDVGEHPLKGKAEPVRLHRAGTVVAAVGGLQRVDGLEAPLVGRDRELRLIKELFHSTEETGRSQLVVLDGEAGVGKSRLGWEFEKYIDGLSRRVRWHRGRCLSYGEGVAFWALAEAVRGRVGLVEEDAGTVVLDGLDALLAELVTDEDERKWLRPRVASLLGEDGREFAKEDLFAAWVRFFERIGAGDPVVLLIDDAEHLDDGLADFLEYLVSGSGLGCFVLLLARPELLATRPQLGGRRATPVRIDPLPDAVMARLVDGLVDGLPDDVRDGLVARAEGIPLFAVETVRALIDRDVVVPVEGRYVVAPGQVVDLSTVGAPASLHALVAARLDALAPTERRVLSDASVLGESFTREGIGILAADVTDLDDILSALARKELVTTEVDRFSTERGQFRFVQSVVRHVAYGTLSRRDRKSRHLLVADHLAGDTDRADDLAQVIAQHLLDAAGSSAPDDPDVPVLRARAGELLVRAAERASALGAYADAARCLDAALACLDDPGDRAPVLKAQAVVNLRLGRLADACRLAREAVRIYDERGEVVAAADASYYVTRAEGLQDHLDDAYQIALDRHASVAGVPGADLVRGRLSSAMATALAFSGRIEEVDEPLHEALRISDRIDDFEMFRNACNALSLSQSLRGSQRVALMVMEGLADMAREREDWNALATALANVGVRYVFTDLGRAIGLSEASQEALTTHGMIRDSVNYTNLLHYNWLAGRWQALPDLVPDAERVGTEHFQATGSSVGVAGLCAWAGNPIVDEPEMPGENNEEYPIAQGFARAGWALIAGDLAGATACLSSVVSQEVAAFGVVDDFHVYWPAAFRVALAAGDEVALNELWSYRTAVLDVFGGVNVMIGHVKVFGALMAVRDGDADPTRVETDLREGIEVLDRCGVVVWRAHAQEDLGNWLLDQGRPEDAEPLLAAARSTYAELEAATWLARIDSRRAQRVG